MNKTLSFMQTLFRRWYKYVYIFNIKSALNRQKDKSDLLKRNKKGKPGRRQHEENKKSFCLLMLAAVCSRGSVHESGSCFPPSYSLSEFSFFIWHFFMQQNDRVGSSLTEINKSIKDILVVLYFPPAVLLLSKKKFTFSSINVVQEQNLI